MYVYMYVCSYVCIYMYMVPHIGLMMAYYAVFFLNFIFPFFSVFLFFPIRIGLDDGHYAVFPQFYFIFIFLPPHIGLMMAFYAAQAIQLKTKDKTPPFLFCLDFTFS